MFWLAERASSLTLPNQNQRWEWRFSIRSYPSSILIPFINPVCFNVSIVWFVTDFFVSNFHSFVFHPNGYYKSWKTIKVQVCTIVKWQRVSSVVDHQLNNSECRHAWLEEAKNLPRMKQWPFLIGVIRREFNLLISYNDITVKSIMCWKEHKEKCCLNH